MEDDAPLGPVARRLAATQRVLCVEDEPDIASFLRAYFRAAGYDLVHIDPADADAVVAAVAEHEPDLMLLDVRLRGFSGTEAYRRIRADASLDYMPIIVVSAHAESDPDFIEPTGLDAFVQKPFNTNSLADLVRERLDAAASQREAAEPDRVELLDQDQLESRVADIVANAGHGRGFALALIRLMTDDAVVSGVGRDGRTHLLTEIARAARTSVPADSFTGRPEPAELAFVFPSNDAASCYGIVQAAIAKAVGEFRFKGGASVPVELAAGVAGYPDNAADVDGLFMAADAALAEAIERGALVHLAL